MKTTRSFPMILAFASLAACADHASDVAQPANDKAPVADVALEEALADAESGRDPAHARTALEGLLAGTTLSKESRIRADNALANLVGATDKERAAAAFEDALSLGDDSAADRLFALLSGHATPSYHREIPAIAESARAFARYLPAATPDRKVDLDLVTFGGAGYDRASKELGTFAIGSALYDNAVAACGYCDDPKSNIHTHHSDLRTWASIPQYAARLEKSFVVLYVDAQTMVPERYAKWLAVPSSEIKSAIDRGEGLVAVKERPGAPPLITIAAPRAAQLPIVEAALSKMSTLPMGATPVKVPVGLTEEEVADGLRVRAVSIQCTKEVLQHRPSASWSVEVTFAVNGAGDVSEIALQGSSASDADLRSCVESHLHTAHFPAWSNDPAAKTTGRFHMLRAPELDKLDAKARAAAVGAANGAKVIQISR